ncbi:pyridoxamine 5'-phosphate oxidase family protein [Streptomyces sp. NPDC056105]|uniref:pyridoxamine 5'-phosphate oxidase family protein n=1 Tax=Streptomyces sp. NPDC056105 TaxID=3345714 RepID=UPI0035E01387
MESTEIVRRPMAKRIRDTLERLVAERDVWVSTAHPDHGPHQVPLWFLWDGRAVWMCTSASSVTARNVRKEPRVRLSLPDTFDVVLIQGEAERFADQEVPGGAAEAFTDKFGWDPRVEEGSFLYVRVVPRTVRAWRGVPELRGRVIMRDGVWLD